MVRGDTARLLSADATDSAGGNKSGKKTKHLFQKVFSKKKLQQEQPAVKTAPNTPEGFVDVTVVASEFDPSKPYKIDNTISELSDAHVVPVTPVKHVGFHAATVQEEEEEEEVVAEEETAAPAESTTAQNSTMLTSFESLPDQSLFTAETTIATSKQEKEDCAGSIVNQTLGFFDDICQIPKKSNGLPHPNPTAVEWGTVPSEDDDTTYRDSLQSTIDESHSDLASFSRYTGTATATTITKSMVVHQKPTIPKSPSQDHENFEVVLDSSILQGPPKRRIPWFSKNDDREDQEEKKEEKEDIMENIAEPIQFEPESSRSPFNKKSLVKRLFSLPKKKKEGSDEEEEDDLQPALQQNQYTEDSIEHTEEEHVSKKEVQKETTWNHLLEQLEPADAAAPDESWKKMVAELDSEEPQKQEDPKPESLKKVEPKGKKEKRHIRHLSWSAVAKTLKKPIIAVRKRAKDDYIVKYESKPPLSPAAAPKQKKPKPVWKAVVDPASGKTYYYHRKTRETTWHKPEELERFEASTGDATPVRKNVSSANAQNPARGETKFAHAKNDASNQQEPDDSMFQTPTRKTAAKESISENSESSSKPTSIVEAALTALTGESKAEEGPADEKVQAPTSTDTFDDTWEKKKEIERLLTDLAPPDKSSVGKLMKEYEGKEDHLLRQLRTKVESQPFDEPFLDEPDAIDNLSSASPGVPAPKFTSRVTTYMSRASATTKSSTLTDKTERVKNTFGGKKHIEPISENMSAGTSISSQHEEDRMGLGTTSFGYDADPRIPSKVPVTRERELKVEDLTKSRVAAETFDSNGRVVRGRAANSSDPEDGSYYGDNEVNSYGTDEVSALSDHETDFMHRKENFEAARRRALDDAIEREDWDLAAALSEGMGKSKPGDYAKAHVSWNQSELDKFIANNDWDAVKSYIARMRGRKNALNTELGALPGAKSTRKSIANAPPRGKSKSGKVDLTQDTTLTKRIGSKSQLQHTELLSESSWTSGSSYDDDSTDSEYS